MSQNEQIPVTVRILDREYQISCSAEERSSLLESARYLDDKMKEIRSNSKMIGPDSIAVMAALNITSDYLQQQNGSTNNNAVSNKQILDLQQKLEMALARCKQTEMTV
jgi:cell division protein ZapA